MADGFDNRCVSCSELCKDPFGHLPFHANTTAGAEYLAQHENTKAGTEPDWIPEHVFVEMSTRVCVECSVQVLTAGQHMKEMGTPSLAEGCLKYNDDAAERTKPRGV